MGVWNFLTGGTRFLESSAAPALASPFAPGNHLEQALVGDFFGQAPTEVVTAEIALRVPEVKRALQAHTSLVAPLRFEVYRDGVKLEAQPRWVSGSTIPTLTPYIRMTNVVTDLYLYGWSLLGATVDPATDLPDDLLHIPHDLWSFRADGTIEVDQAIPTQYRQRLIAIPLGANGLLADGIDTVREARKLNRARQERLDAPPAATELHITDASRDQMTPAEQKNLADAYKQGRANGSIAVTPSYLEIKERGTAGNLDLFESAKNSVRIDLANHAGVPAAFIEGGKEGGTTSTLSYSNQGDRNSELWLFGSAAYCRAIEARLSADDVVGPGAEVRADLTPIISTPLPAVADPTE